MESSARRACEDGLGLAWLGYQTRQEHLNMPNSGTNVDFKQVKENQGGEEVQGTANEEPGPQHVPVPSPGLSVGISHGYMGRERGAGMTLKFLVWAFHTPPS